MHRDWVGLLTERATSNPERRAFTYLNETHTVEKHLSFGELHQRAQAIAIELNKRGLSLGDRALLMYPSGLDFISAFFGCLYAGVIAVPAFPPHKSRKATRLELMAQDSTPKIILCPSSVFAQVEISIETWPALANLTWLQTDLISLENSIAFTPPKLTEQSLAFLQYTSGSTGNPKGVMVSHGNLIHNAVLLKQAFNDDENSVYVSWLPIFHDMGLIGGVLQPVFSNAYSVLMSPASFISDPSRWLSAIDKYRGTHSAAPNFAYDLCYRKIPAEKVKALDLRSWKFSLCAAEPVKRNTVEQFQAVFSKAGLPSFTVRSGYGLAEATLAVSGGAPDGEKDQTYLSVDTNALEDHKVQIEAQKNDTNDFAENCRISDSVEIVIVDPITFARVSGSEVGEIWVKGQNVALGYWNRPAETESTFQAKIASGEGPYLRTGDLGFLNKNSVYITGRIKDLIILRGRNHYPQDLEWTSEESHSALRPGCSAAFSLEAESGEQLVLVHEVRRNFVKTEEDAENIFSAIRTSVAREHEVTPDILILIPEGSIAKTTSGKIQRQQVKKYLLQNKLAAVADSRAKKIEESKIETAAPEIVNPKTPTEAALGFLFSQALGRPIMNTRMNFFSAGGHSLAAIQLSGAISDFFKKQITADVIFQFPTIEGLAGHLDGSKTENVVAVPSASQIARVGREQAIPLSFEQELLWMSAQLDPNSTADIETGAIRIEGSVDSVLMQKAFDFLIERHEAFRMNFVESDSKPLIRTVKNRNVRLQLRKVDDTEIEALIPQIVREQTLLPFRLESDVLLRISLLSGTHQNALVLSFHHAVIDRVSIPILIRELCEVYSQLHRGSTPQLPALNVEYCDYANWQRTTFSEKSLTQDLEYWQKLLKSSEVLELPTDRPRPKTPTFRGKRLRFKFSEEESALVRQFTKAQGTTLFVTLLGVFKTLLSRYSGQENILVGVPISNRTLTELQNLVGCALNTVLIRTDFTIESSFQKVLEQVSEGTLNALRHQKVPFSLLSKTESEGSLNGLLRAVFTVENAWEVQKNETWPKVEVVGDLDSGSAKYDLFLALSESKESLEGVFEYSEDLFDAETIERMVLHFRALVMSLLSNPSQSVFLGDLVTKDEKMRLVEWNSTPASFPNPILLHHIFDKQRALTPQACALEFEGKRLTYDELNLQSTKVANFLRSQGIGPEMTVAICMERSLELVVGILGILKSGAAYVPMDPDYPQSRLLEIVEDSQARLLLTQEKWSQVFSKIQILTLCLDRDQHLLQIVADVKFPELIETPNQLAYIVYTSGSTGKPKGISVSHETVHNYLHWMQRDFPLNEKDAVLQKTSIGWDGSVWEIFSPWLAGARLILAKPEGQRIPGYIESLIIQHQIRILQTVPSQLKGMFQDSFLDECTSIEWAFSGGEALPTSLFSEFRRRLPWAKLLNVYGPTETTLDATSYLCTSKDEGRAFIPVGPPLPNYQVYLVDSYLQICPLGVPGEICIGGSGVTRGYLRLPSLTAKTFVPDPFSKIAGSRLYRTGDLGRRLADGTIEYLGRLDEQVKIQGVRVELGEIETKIKAQKGIREVFVTLLKSDSKQHLVAYCLREKHSPHEEILKEALLKELPYYLVPERIVYLEAFPLTPNGKLDRKALPKPNFTDFKVTKKQAPEGEIEKHVAKVWEEILGKTEIGKGDNFFELGGHSLNATRVISRLKQRLQIEIPLRTLFQASTLENFALRLKEIYEKPDHSRLPSLRKNSRKTTIPLSYSQERLWFVEQFEKGRSPYIERGEILIRGKLNAPLLLQTLKTVFSRHEIFQTRFYAVDGKPVQEFVPDRVLPCKQLNLSHLSESEQRNACHQALEAEMDSGFHLKNDPLVHFILIQLSDTDHRLYLLAHHIVYDGWSINILLNEIAAHYRNPEIPLPAVHFQYSDFTDWQRSDAVSSVYEKQLDFWEKSLTGTSVLELPTDFPRPKNQDFTGQQSEFSLTKELTEKLEKLCQKEGTTLFAGISAAVKVLLSRYSLSDDVTVGTLLSGRNEVEFENIVGFFPNTLALRTDLSGDLDFRKLLAREKTVHAEAFSNQDVPFEKIIERIKPVRDASRTPIFQVLVVVEKAPSRTKKIHSELSFELQELPAVASIFDLGFYFLHEPGKPLTCRLEFAQSLFKRETVERMASQLLEFLNRVVERPSLALRQIPILTDGEKQKICNEWNATSRIYDSRKDLVSLFEGQVERSPLAEALRFEGVSVSYEELNVRANRLARRLQSQGVKPSDFVGIFMERSLEMVVALLGTLKAGAAYAPLDPSYPFERIQYMIENSKLKLILTQPHVEEKLPQVSVPIESLEEGWSGDGAAHNLGKYNPLLPAYLIYTSGSTGRPKGVVNSHAGIVNRLLWMQERYQITPQDRILQKTPFSFDVSVWEFFWPLIVGARLVIAKPEGHKDAAYLAKIIQDEKITVLHFVPPMLRVFLEEKTSHSCHSLKQVMCSGEELPADVVEDFFKSLPAKLHNLYGPTEAAVDVTSWECERHRSIQSVPIGKPIANIQTYVLDADLNLCPFGVSGELYLAGVGLAWGYIHQPAMTAEKFIPNPFGESGSRLYRTGDLCRLLPDGNIEYQGRIDNQVKIRGFRIETGEIENALRDYSGVANAVVLPKADKSGNKRLIAYLVAKSESETSQDIPALKNQVNEWQSVFNESYATSGDSAKSEFDIVSWNSSYDLKPIPSEQMQEWVDNTVERVLQHQPQTVLEIGCGTGLLLYRISPHCKRYVGCDISNVAVAKLENYIRSSKRFSNVEVFQASAHDFTKLKDEKFDLIILNSVVQYFPNLEYLVEVLDEAGKRLNPRGKVFLGDLRNFDTLDFFQAGVVSALSQAKMTTKTLKRKVEHAIQAESELVLSPEIFSRLKSKLPWIQSIILQPKQGKYDNEMNRYRYDVVLGCGKVEKNSIQWQEWSQGLNLDAVKKQMRESSETILAYKGISDPRVVADEVLLGGLANEGAVLPSVWKEFIEDSQWKATLCFCHPECKGRYDVILSRNGSLSLAVLQGIKSLKEDAILSTNPLKSQVAKKLIPHVKQALKLKLPEFMIPSDFLLVEKLPVSSNGKIDRKALLSLEDILEGSTPRSLKSFEAPRNESEKKIALIWEELLNQTQIGIKDNFFELGGHSLFAIQALSRISEAFGKQISTRAFFANPTVEEIARLLSLGLPSDTTAPIPSSRTGKKPSLSYSQERLLVLHELERDNRAYNIPLTFRLRGLLDCDLVEKALNFVIQRHEILQTVYPFQRQATHQEILTSEPLKFDIETVAKEFDWLSRLKAHCFSRFDLEKGPIVRALLLKFDEQDFILQIVVHHIAFDEWSVPILYREFVSAYEQMQRNEAPRLPVLPIQFADFASWQRASLTAEKMNLGLAYWKDKLANANALELPLDKPRPPVQTFEGDHVRFVLNQGLLKRLEAFSAAEKTTLFTTLFSAYNVFLSRYSGQKDITVGIPITNRNHASIEPLIGFFLNTIAFRSHLDERMMFDKLVQKTAEELTEAFQYSDLPFEKVTEAVATQRDLSRPAVFQTMFVLNQAFPKIEFCDIKGEILDLSLPSSKFDLSLSLMEDQNKLLGDFEFNTSLFHRSTIEAMARNFEALLENLLECKMPLGSIPLLHLEEKNTLKNWNQTKRPYASEVSIHDWIERQVAKNPEAIALRWDGGSLTYAQLNAKSNQLARVLRRQGVTPESFVGILFHRSPEMVLSILGILKAGAAYIPFEPTQPHERLKALMEDSQIKVLMTRKDAHKSEIQSSAFTTFFVDSYFESDANDETTNLNLPVHPDSLAYTIYTSGSTGTPKGGMNSHRSLSNRILWMQEAFPLQSDDVLLQKTPYTFDVSVWEFLWPFVTGASLVIAKPEGHKDSFYLAQVIEDFKVTTLHFVPPMLKIFLDTLEPSLCTSLKRVIVSGEALPTETQNLFFKKLNAELHNLYGPTEAAIDVTHWKCETSDAPVPIGFPIANTTMHILNSDFQPVPVGAHGELFIGGIQVGRGYHNRPDLTAERFVPDPFSKTPGKRLYRTGDLARYLPSGAIEFLGRNDFQVKIHGLRIELGEIEATLRQCPEVKECVVVAYVTPTEKRLSAYLVAESKDLADIKAQLGHKLPSYMIPHHWTLLEKMPLNANGKIDRKALPPPDGLKEASRKRPRSSYQVLSPMERRIQSLWEEVLKIKSVGIDENFFELGGTSLLMIQVHAKLKMQLEGKLELISLFQFPTVRTLSKSLQNRRFLEENPSEDNLKKRKNPLKTNK